jgi:hypothetical protein
LHPLARFHPFRCIEARFHVRAGLSKSPVPQDLCGRCVRRSLWSRSGRDKQTLLLGPPLTDLTQASARDSSTSSDKTTRILEAHFRWKHSARESIGREHLVVNTHASSYLYERMKPKKTLSSTLVSQQRVLLSQLNNQQILPQSKQGWCKARTKVASARGSMIGSRKCRLRVVFHSQPLPQTRGSRRVEKLFVGASFCSGTWSFPLVLPLAERHTASIHSQAIVSAVASQPRNSLVNI